MRASPNGWWRKRPSLVAWLIIECQNALQEYGGGCDALALPCNFASEGQLIHQSAPTFRGDGVTAPGRHEERIEGHAQDDGFPAQEDPSKAASGARGPAAREEGGPARTKEREDQESGWPAKQP